MEFPEIPDGDKYVTYDDNKEEYGFLKGDVGSLVPYITDCTNDGKDYIITAELRNTETDEVKGTYELSITKTSFDGDDNCFNYSVTSIKEKGSSGAASSTEENTTATSETSESTDQNSTETTSEENTTESGATDNTSSNGSSEGISQDDALQQAKAYYGSDAEYSYKSTITVGDKEYYDFSVKGDNVSSTDVLVSLDGQDVIGGTINDDGSWSFDQ